MSEQEQSDYPITIKNLLDTVAHMRKAQKEYFKSRQPNDLINSKRLETSVDIRLGELGLEVK